jgi:hypothetical protein
MEDYEKSLEIMIMDLREQLESSYLNKAIQTLEEALKLLKAHYDQSR